MTRMLRSALAWAGVGVASGLMIWGTLTPAPTTRSILFWTLLIGASSALYWRVNVGPIEKPWGPRLWLIASFLFMLAAWQRPATRSVNLSLGVVFGVLGMSAARRSSGRLSN